MASVKIRNGRLYLQYYDNILGYSRTETLRMKSTQENLREAKRIAKNYTPDLVNEKMYKNQSKFLTFSDGNREFLSIKNYRPHTVRLHSYAVEKFIAATDDRPLVSYTIRDYAKLLEYFKTCKTVKEKVIDEDENGNETEITHHLELSVNSKAIYTRHLHILFEYLKEQGYVKQNIIKITKPQGGTPKPIPKKDRDRILEALKAHKEHPWHYALIKFMMNTGIRISTALELKWDDIDWNHRIIYFRNIKVNGNEYTFPLTKVLEKVLKDLGKKKEGKVFPFKGVDSIGFWIRVQNNLGIIPNHGIHKLKHSFVSELINMGRSLADISELTNTSMETLRKWYAQMDKRRINKELEGVEL